MIRQTAPMRPATYQDVLDAPDRMVAELIGGALHLNPRPASPHAVAASGLGSAVHMAFHRGQTGPGGWWILDEPELHFTEADVLVPDIAGWRRDTLPRIEAVPYFTTAPDWACEVLSPRTREYDVTEKRDVYARHGVGHLWFLDPLARTLEAFALDGGSWRLIGAAHGESEVAFAPFQALTVALGTLWLDRSDP